MKITHRFIRILGILGAAWIISMLISAHIQIHQQTQDLILGSDTQIYPVTSYFLTATIPFCLLAGLLVLPYKKMNKGFRITGVVLIALLSIYFLFHLFGQYFLSSRFVPEVIPGTVWIYAFLLIGLFTSQIVAILHPANK